MPNMFITFAYFFPIWVGLGIGGFFLFYRGKDAAFKRRWWPYYAALAGAFFLAYLMVCMVLERKGMFPRAMLIAVVPLIISITRLNIKQTKFCENCGAMLINGGAMGSPMKYCPRCGTPLDSRTSSGRGDPAARSGSGQSNADVD